MNDRFNRVSRGRDAAPLTGKAFNAALAAIGATLERNREGVLTDIVAIAGESSRIIGHDAIQDLHLEALALLVRGEFNGTLMDRASRLDFYLPGGPSEQTTFAMPETVGELKERLAPFYDIATLVQTQALTQQQRSGIEPLATQLFNDLQAAVDTAIKDNLRGSGRG